jgi:hypothetical protein
MQMKKLCVISVLALAGCGGGGGSQQPTTAAPSNPVTANPTPQEVVYFSEVKNAIPSLSSYYDRTCGSKSNSFLVPAVDLNKDNRKDLLILLWCEVPTYGMTLEGPTKNTLVSLLQNSDGTYRLGNQELFGKSFIDLSGLIAEGVDVTIGDFNGDKYPDLVFATTWEDGRYGLHKDGQWSWNSYIDVMFSQPDNTYKVERIDNNRSMYNEVILIKGKDRDSFTSNGYIFTYQNQVWSKNYIYFSPDADTQGIAKSAVFHNSNTVTQAVESKTNFGFQIGSVDLVQGYGIPGQHNRYTNVDSTILSTKIPVTVYGSSSYGDQLESLATIDNVEYLSPSYNSSCTFTEGQDTYIAAEFFALKLQEKYTGQRLSWKTSGNPNGNVSFENAVTRIHLYKINNGKISRVNSPALDKDIKTTHYLNCTDVNGDNKVDVVVYRWGHQQEKSVVFLNNGNGNLTEVASNKIPDILKVYHGHHTMFSDLNNDNRTEIIYGPGLGYATGYAGNYTDYQVFQSVNPLKNQ